MTEICTPTAHFPRSRDLKPFRRPTARFNLWHSYLGTTSIDIFRPSMRGCGVSRDATSSTFSYTRLSSSFPISGWVISRPRKKTETFTRCFFSISRRIWLILKSTSCSLVREPNFAKSKPHNASGWGSGSNGSSSAKRAKTYNYSRWFIAPSVDLYAVILATFNFPCWIQPKISGKALS